jgi:hypothetical protein
VWGNSGLTRIGVVGSGGDQWTIADFPSVSFTTRQRARVRVDMAAKTVEMWTDGVPAAENPVSIAGVTGDVSQLGRLAVGGYLFGGQSVARHADARLEAIIAHAGAAGAGAVEAAWARLPD